MDRKGIDTIDPAYYTVADGDGQTTSRRREEEVTADDAVKKQNERLEPLIEEWSTAIVMPGQVVPEELPDIGARVTFELMGEKACVLERWRVPAPRPPTSIHILQ